MASLMTSDYVVDRGGGDETAGGMMISDGLPDDL